MVSIPDRIAYTRMALVPVILTLVLANEHIPHAFGFAAALMVAAGFTDFLDGYLARRWRQTSALGAFLDSIADKLLVSGALFGLVEVGRAWAWAGFLIIGREIAISGLRGIAAMDGIKVPPSLWGKIKANVQYLAIFLALLRTPEEIGGLFLDQWVLIVAVVVTMLSAVQYFIGFAAVIRSDTARA